MQGPDGNVVTRANLNSGGRHCDLQFQRYLSIIKNNESQLLCPGGQYNPGQSQIGSQLGPGPKDLR